MFIWVALICVALFQRICPLAGAPEKVFASASYKNKLFDTPFTPLVPDVPDVPLVPAIGTKLLLKFSIVIISPAITGLVKTTVVPSLAV